MLVENNVNLPSVRFSQGVDIVADTMSAMQQFLATEISERTKDFIETPGFAWGLQVGDLNSKSVTITEGVGFLVDGTRIQHSKTASYNIELPTGQTSGYLYVKAVPTNISYRTHPYNGTRHSVETLISLEFGTIKTSDAYIDQNGNIYNKNNDGLIIARLDANGATYTVYSSVAYQTRSPYVGLRTGV
jgi:hypothetical protein